MARQGHWNLSKVAKLSICQLIATFACLVVVLFYSPQSETLLKVSSGRLLIYSFFYGLFLLISGEVIGLFDNGHRSLIWKKLLLSFMGAALASFFLILIVWIIDYQFVGRFVVSKIFIVTGIFVFLFLFSIDRLNRRNPWRVLVYLPEFDSVKFEASFNQINTEITWLYPTSDSVHTNLIEYCINNNIDMIVCNKTDFEFDMIGLLASGVRILDIASFFETFSQKIPHSEVSQNWLSKLELRQNGPFARRVKRVSDILLGIIGVVIFCPLFLVACLATLLESGFPIFYCQKRTGYLGRPYVLIKIRTMKRNAESKEALWASNHDNRITFVGGFLRKTRIDEIPQLWNVIKGEMSIVGPRPERPELDKEIANELPFWHSRYLLKPGLTGWAQIKYQYASDLETSEEKLAYDLFYIKNASFFLDLEIILSTLRSITKGSR